MRSSCSSIILGWCGSVSADIRPHHQNETPGCASENRPSELQAASNVPPYDVVENAQH